MKSSLISIDCSFTPEDYGMSNADIIDLALQVGSTSLDRKADYRMDFGMFLYKAEYSYATETVIVYVDVDQDNGVTYQDIYDTFEV